jgi:hypothetical protein
MDKVILNGTCTGKHAEYIDAIVSDGNWKEIKKYF